jgi:hypothetical protein
MCNVSVYVIHPFPTCQNATSEAAVLRRGALLVQHWQLQSQVLSSAASFGRRIEAVVGKTLGIITLILTWRRARDCDAANTSICAPNAQTS